MYSEGAEVYKDIQVVLTFLECPLFLDKSNKPGQDRTERHFLFDEKINCVS